MKMSKVFIVSFGMVFLSAYSLVNMPAAFGQVQTAGLRIMVIEGEAGVNIVRQNTAVKPVVEVRDRNNLPVAGAVVQFILPSSGPGGTFATGQKTFSVVTDAVGRATSSAVRLQGTGAFQIQVNASFQGETVTTTVGQTNFATAANAARAGKSVTNSGGTSSSGASTGATAASTGSTAASTGSTAASTGATAVSTGASAVSGAAGTGLSTLVISGVAAGVGTVGTVAQSKASTGTDCTVQANTLFSGIDAAESTCQADTSPSQSQCHTALQSLLDTTGKLCSCIGTAAVFQTALAQYGLSPADLSALTAEAKKEGLTLPAACGY
jgi:hypothetical protein